MTSAETDRESLAEPVYRDLLRAIISGARSPGTRLKERELSELYSVSRVPVRQAIQRLEAEGFALSEPRRGAVVRKVSTDDINQLFDARLCIEPFATRMAADRLQAGIGDSSRMHEFLLDSTRSFEVGDGARGLNSNLGFHDEIVRLSGNTLLVDFLQPMLGRMEWVFGLTHASREAEQTLEHQQLYEALVSGNAELAAAQAYSHIELGRAPTLAALESFLDS
ncbi:GntR family transcriptional regulator [Cryobacterium sp. PH31-O1]|uniref:GntR family transcriptional regulator n=1 Tax=Cryobacterium sp. PH31-O1 TaxID=3046306 RepID=UPI0024B90036|nr:GntR family transcriptional regulator [Cryobacterium sp. PH31-O1]MDJ0338557.1 GntR family transcriptional regulator [Cryobacterium sp. PH31-O1]